MTLTLIVLALFVPVIIFAADSFNLSPNSGLSIVVGSPATAQWSLRTSGDIFGTVNNNAVTDRGDWLQPKSHAANYEVRSTLLSGVFTADPSAGAFVALSADRTWTLTQAGLGSSTTTATIDIRRVGTTTILATTTLTLNAERD